jgi:hypothetical protein
VTFVHTGFTFDQALAIFFALLTALSNALAVTTQHIASVSEGKQSSSWRLFMHLIRQPLWLAGWLALVGSLVFQALALHFGPMSEVQPILVFELVVALLLRRLWIHQSIRKVTWVAALVACVGLVTFLVVTSPRGGVGVPATSSWVGPVALGLGVTAVLIVGAQRGSPSRRAALFASATGVMWALEATFIKATTNTVSSAGFAGSLGHWPIYALAIGGVAGLFCEQAALHVGPLKVSQPFIVIVDPIVSVVLGVWLYGERVHHAMASIALGGLSFVVMCAGVVVLTQTAPDTMKAELHRL